MAARTDNPATRWAFAAAVAALAFGVVMVLFHSPRVRVEKRIVVTPPSVLLQPADSKDAAFDETKVLFDPTPLFLPTRWNAAPRGVPRPEPGATFQNYPDVLSAPPANKELKFS